MADTVKKKIAKKRASVAKTKALHDRNTKARAAQVADIRATYVKEKDGALLTDILAKAKSFADYHTKIAKDGVGSRKTGYKLENGQEEAEIIYLKHGERVTHLDKAAGIEELLGYIERMCEPPKPEGV